MNRFWMEGGVEMGGDLRYANTALRVGWVFVRISLEKIPNEPQCGLI